MKHDDAELEQMRAGVSCAVLLERAGYELDKAESTRKCLKYRRGAGEIVIVNHDGRGWWDSHRPGSDKQGRGDVFALAQYLDPGLNFGRVRKPRWYTDPAGDARGPIGVAGRPFS